MFKAAINYSLGLASARSKDQKIRNIDKLIITGAQEIKEMMSSKQNFQSNQQHEMDINHLSRISHTADEPDKTASLQSTIDLPNGQPRLNKEMLKMRKSFHKIIRPSKVMKSGQIKIMERGMYRPLQNQQLQFLDSSAESITMPEQPSVEASKEGPGPTVRRDDSNEHLKDVANIIVNTEGMDNPELTASLFSDIEASHAAHVSNQNTHYQNFKTPRHMMNSTKEATSTYRNTRTTLHAENAFESQNQNVNIQNP